MRAMILIFLGSGIGGLLRFVLGSLIYSYTGRKFPYGTLFINVTGSLIIGFGFVIVTEKFTNFAPYLISFLLVGILGGYTTFATFSLETLRLFQDGKIAYALLNLLSNTVLSVLLTWIGYIAARKLLGV